MKSKTGTFVISLDLELYWGMIDKVTLEEYGDNLLGVQKAVPAMLEVFSEYELHVTWATVGMMTFKDRDSLLRSLPPVEKRPVYTDKSLSTYCHIEDGLVGESPDDDPYHYGIRLLNKITEVPNQEIASHTFSHLYALDMEEDKQAFATDIRAAIKSLSPWTASVRSLVFPRNQTKEVYLNTCKEEGLLCYRGNENHFLYRPRKEVKQSLWIRGLRLLDHYINISGYHTYNIYKVNHKNEGEVFNVPASRFLRPWSSRLRVIESLRRRRIKKAMTHAARNGEAFHLWWHPHNFGTNQAENIKTLRVIAEHFQYLKEHYQMKSATMAEVSEQMLG